MTRPKDHHIMRPAHLTFVLAVAALSLTIPEAQAQSSFALPNPLMRPQVREQAKANAAQGQDAPRAQAVPPPPGSNNSGQLAPLPLSGAAGDKSPADRDSALRDTLSAYTVTAIVGDAAILRNYAGHTVMPAGTGTTGGTPGQPGTAIQNSSGMATGLPGQQGAGGQGNMTQTLAVRSSVSQVKQSTIRVKTGVQINVAGTLLVPTVDADGVTFRLPKVLTPLYVVALESQSAQPLTANGLSRESNAAWVQARSQAEQWQLQRSQARAARVSPSAPRYAGDAQEALNLLQWSFDGGLRELERCMPPAAHATTVQVDARSRETLAVLALPNRGPASTTASFNEVVQCLNSGGAAAFWQIRHLGEVPGPAVGTGESPGALVSLRRKEEGS